MLQCWHLFYKMRKWKKVAYEESCSYKWLKGRRNLNYLCAMGSVPKERAGRFFFVWRSKLETKLITIQCNAIQCNQNKFHYRGSAFVAYVLYGSWWKKDLNLLPCTYVKLWYGTWWNLWVWKSTSFFLCSHGGCNKLRSNHGQWWSNSEGLHSLVH